jgi:hypothetical protein
MAVLIAATWLILGRVERVSHSRFDGITVALVAGKVT